MRDSIRLAIAALLVLPALASAQVRGLPVVNNGAASGVGIGAEIGLPNDEAGGGTTLGASAGLGMGPLGLTAAVSRSTPDNGATVWSQGAALSLRLFGGPLVPFRVTLQGGAAIWDEGAIDGLHVPLSVGFAATIPNPLFAIRPWIAPRIDLVRTELNGVSDGTVSEFGISGGIELGFITGLAIRVAYDRILTDDSPSILSFGVGFALGR
jgi:hypothetical protein